MSSEACNINLQSVQLLRKTGTFCKDTYNGTWQDLANSLEHGTMSLIGQPYAVYTTSRMRALAVASRPRPSDCIHSIIPRQYM